MTFANPHMLWLLLLIPPAMLAFFWWSGRKRGQLMTLFIQERLLAGLTVGISPARRKIRLSCVLLAAACLVLALGRPQLGFDWEEARLRGLDIVVAIDTSKSMLAEDIAPNRLTRAKLAALDLMQQAKSDRLGLVAFAGNAFLQCPLTIDDAVFRQCVEALNVNTIPQGGTAIAEAIDTALTAFKEGDNHKVLVLFSDGEDQDSDALESARKAAQAGLRIYTIGFGTQDGDLLRIKDDQGNSDYVRDEQHNVVKSHLNENLLREIAGATEGGFYLPLRGAKTIDTLYEQGLARLPKSDRQEKFIKRYHERFHWPLAAAIVLLLAEVFFPERKPGSKTKSPTAAARTGSVAGFAMTIALVVLLALPRLALGSSSSALREYKAGNYGGALKEYEHLLQRQSNDPRLHFNAGAAAYRTGQFTDAAKQFGAVLGSPDLNLQQLGYYNRGNSLYYLGESDPEPKKKIETWQKSLQDFESALKLNPQDGDAKFNREFVRKKLEELKQQQQQSNQQKKQEQQPQDQQKDQSQQQQKQQAQQNQEQKKQDSSKQEQQTQQQKQEDQQQQAASPSQAQKEEQQQQQTQSAAQPKDQSDEKAQETAAATQAGQMTQQEARQLLDSQKSQEIVLPPKPDAKPRNTGRPFRDW